MTATDELRRLLDERGVEYRVSATGYSIDIGPNMTAYANRTDTTLDVSLRGFTPEQAIAATLGGGMLTADDVRDLIERHSDASGGNGRDFHNGAYVAIADELNATLGRGEWYDEDGTLHIRCHRLPDHIDVTLPDSRGREVHSARVYEYVRREECHDTDEDANDFCCSECGARLYVSTSDVYTMMLGDEKTILEHPNFCPNCGAKVMAEWT